MAIQLEFINLIVPIKTIREKYPGGWEQCLVDHKHLVGGRIWYDDNLFRDGAMSPADMKHLVDEWERRGFRTRDDKDNPGKWVDVCVVEALFGGATLPCHWIEVDGNTAFLKGTSRGEVIGRDNFSHNGPDVIQ